MGGEESARDLPQSDHHRRRAELAHDRLAVPAADVLPGHRWRRRADPDVADRAQGFPAQAGLYPGHRRERRNADGQPDGGFHLLARLPRRRADGVPRGRHRPQGRRSPDDLRRLRASADLRAGGSRFPPARRGGRVHRRAQHRAGRQAAVEHQWRRPVLHALRHVRHVCAAGERAADARHRAGAGGRREDFGVPRRRRHVRRVRHDHLLERGAL